MRMIKFCDIDDFSFYHNLSQAEEVLKKLDLSKRNYKVNEILEFYIITKFSKVKNCNLKNMYKKEIEFLYKEISSFIKQLTDKSFYKYYRNVDSFYLATFWEMINDYIDNTMLSNLFINQVFSYKKFYINYFLNCKNLVKKYELELRKFLLKNHTTAELLLEEYEIDNIHHKKFYFPNFTNLEIEKIFYNYINSDNANINYLKIIPFLSCKEIQISDNIKLHALKKSKEKTAAFFSNNNGIEFGSEIKIGDFDETIKIDKRNNIIIYNYDSKWIKKNLDYPTLLNNFIYLFCFVDRQMRFTNVSKINKMSIFEKELGLHTKNEYKIDLTFQLTQSTALMQMISYNTELKTYNIEMEKCLDWFYKTYLKEEFKIADFITHIESSPENYFEKCRVLFPEIDGIIKQFAIYQEYREIDHDLIEISNNSILFENVKSLNKHKYVYGNEKKLNFLNYLIFSDQSRLRYLKGYEKHNSFYELIRKENVKLKDFNDYQKSDLHWLFENKIIKLDRKGNIKFYDIREVIIYYDLYFNEVISFYHYPTEYQKLILKLAKKGNLFLKNTLFSEPETKYLNFYLNNRSASNSLSLRNRYGHGIQPREDNEEIHKQNYMYLLYIIVLITIKINDDLCIFAENSKI